MVFTIFFFLPLLSKYIWFSLVEVYLPCRHSELYLYLPLAQQKGGLAAGVLPFRSVSSAETPSSFREGILG